MKRRAMRSERFLVIVSLAYINHEPVEERLVSVGMVIGSTIRRASGVTDATDMVIGVSASYDEYPTRR